MTPNTVPGKRKAVPGHKGIYSRVTRAGETVYDALATVTKNGKSTQIHLGTRDSLGDAVALRELHFDVLAQHGQPTPDKSGPLTVRMLGKMYIREADPPRWDRSRWEARVTLAHFIDWPVSQVTPADVKKWVHTMAITRTPKGEIPTRPTVFSALVLLRRVFRWACMAHRGYMLSNPAHDVTITDSTEQKLKSGRDLFDYLREDECQRVIKGRSKIPFKAWVKFMVLMFSGCRPVGVWTLRWERVDWSSKTIVFHDSKGENSSGEVRHYTVHMLDPLHSALREWWIKRGQPTTGLVFRSAAGGGIYDTGYDAGWQDRQENRRLIRNGIKSKGEKRVIPGLRAKLGIARDVPLYSLRHTCACQLLLGSKTFTGGRRWSREEVQSHLGHLDAKSTEHYMRALGILAGQAVAESRDAKRALKLVPSE